MASDLVVCPRCGHVFNQADVRLQKLPPTAGEVWHRLEPYFAQRVTLGVVDVAQIIASHKSTAHYHLQTLCKSGLVVPVPIRENGTYVRYRAG